MFVVHTQLYDSFPNCFFVQNISARYEQFTVTLIQILTSSLQKNPKKTENSHKNSHNWPWILKLL